MTSDLSNLAFRDRMNACSERCGNQNQLAKQSGIPINTLRRYYEGSEPNRPTLEILAKAAKVSLEWLVSGNGPMEPSGEPARATENSPSNAPQRTKDDGYARLPRLLGSKILPSGERTLLYADAYAFVPRDWVEHGIKGINPENIAVFISHGSEMEPEIRDNEMLLIDTSTNERMPIEGRRLVRHYDNVCVRYITRMNRDTFLMRHRQTPPNVEGVRFTFEQLGHDVDILGKILVALRYPETLPLQSVG